MDRKAVQAAMTAAFGGTDASGTWSWKQAYDVAEIALTLFLQRYGPAMLSKAGSPARMLGLPTALEPPQTRLDDVQQRYQQFSTPLAITGTVAAAAAARPDDVVLEPSAGTGTLAVLRDPRPRPRRRRVAGLPAPALEWSSAGKPWSGPSR